MAKPICFVSCLFTHPDVLVDVPGNFKQLAYADYKLLTNLPPTYFQTSWEILNVPLKCNGNLVKTSRYYKFMLWELEQFTQYNVIVYCDAYMHPLHTVNWRHLLAPLVSNMETFIVMQSRHRFVQTVADEIPYIMKAHKAVKQDLDNAIAFMQLQCDNSDIRNISLYENMTFAYNPRNATFRQVSYLFWKLYCDERYSITRDQPLWSVCLFKCQVVPFCNIPFMLKCFHANTEHIMRTHNVNVYNQNLQ
jgi:hypothetical protein